MRLTRAFTNSQLKDIIVVVFPLSKHFMTVLKNVPTFQELKANPPRKQFILLNKQTIEQRNWTETMIRSHGEENKINVRNFENTLTWSAKSYLHLSITAFQ